MVNQLPAGGQIRGNGVVQKTWPSTYGSLHARQFTCGTAFLSKYRTHLKASHEKLQI